MSLQPNPNDARQAHGRGLALLFVAAVLGVGMAMWLGTWGADFRVRAAIIQGGGDAVQRPYPRTGLVPTNENRGQVLFGRYCDSCHTAGLETPLGDSLRSPQFKSKYTSESEIINCVRKGCFKMPDYSPYLLPDEDLKAIAAYTLSLPDAP